MNTPLEGIKILDLSRVLALPFATMILSDLGAQVIKVEKPFIGDETRHWGPPFLGTESAYFLCVNRNKKSITVDFKKPEGQNIIKDLAKHCDIFVENYKVDELKKYSLDYDNIKAINPKIVYCSLTGYGQNGIKSNLPGYDFIMQGVSGLMSITGALNGQPTKVGVAILDIIAGLYATIGIIASLYNRQKLNRSEYLDIALYDCAISALANVASNYLIGGKVPKRYGNAHPNIVPYQTFKAKDKYFNLAVGNDEQFKRLIFVLGDESLKNKKFELNPARVRYRKELIKILQGIFRKQTAIYWVKLFEENNIPAGLINDLDEVFSDNQIYSRDILKVLKNNFGEFKLVGSPLKLKESHLKKSSAPPLLGEHTREILTSILGYNEDKILDLKKTQII